LTVPGGNGQRDRPRSAPPSRRCSTPPPPATSAPSGPGVFTVARHRAVDRWRRRARRHDKLVPLEALADLPALDDPGEAALDAISTRAAVALLATLPRDQAEVILLRVVAGLDVAQAATITGKRPAPSG
jgi:predicted RNA polymerase sigma factor